ncbi:MAG: phosphoribosylglycinamide formyltransferase [Treponema sp.]|nr:phosphoribosylglycinamide formyltransferase [Treponema sp.]MCL2236638.1 phosphoribosylglycinamide formyltransferase [Treponema sp.]
MRIAVLVSGGGTNLQALIDANIQISLVISSVQNAYAIERAKNAGIKTLVIERKSFKDINEYDNSLADALTQEKTDLVVLAGFLSILGEKVLSAFSNKIINVHPSLIPSFCGKGFYGLKVHEAVLDYGVKVTGATVHLVNEVVDGGKIILQKAIDVLPSDTAEALQKRVMQECEWVLLPKAVEMFCKGEIK